MGNLGSEVRLRVIIEDIKKAHPEAKITVATFGYNSIEKEEGVSYITLSNILTGVLELIAFHIWRFNYIINAEGIPFVDFCGKGFINFFVPILLASWMYRKKSLCYAFDVDRLSVVDNFLVRFALERTTMLVTRTTASRDVLKKIGLKHPVSVGSDCSFLFSPRKKYAFSKKKKIGFVFKDFFCYPIKIKLFGKKEDLYHYPFFYEYKNDGKKTCSDFKESMATLVSVVLSKHPTEEVQFIINEPQMDERITMDIYNKISRRLRKRIEIVSKKDKSLDYMKQNFKQLKYLVASRYHAVLLSLEYNVPTLVLSTDERFEYILKELRLQNYVIDVYNNGISSEQLLMFISKRNDSHKRFKSYVSNIYPSLVKRARKNYLFIKKFLEE